MFWPLGRAGQGGGEGTESGVCCIFHWMASKARGEVEDGWLLSRPVISSHSNDAERLVKIPLVEVSSDFTDRSGSGQRNHEQEAGTNSIGLRLVGGNRIVWYDRLLGIALTIRWRVTPTCSDKIWFWVTV